jgi:hypothetical protein
MFGLVLLAKIISGDFIVDKGFLYVAGGLIISLILLQVMSKEKRRVSDYRKARPYKTKEDPDISTGEDATDNNNLSPREKMLGLPGRLIGVFLIPTGLLLIGLNYLTIHYYGIMIKGEKGVGMASIILGIAALILIPQNITLSDFLNNRSEFVKKIWVQSNMFLRLLWLGIICFSIYIIFYFL